MAIDAGHEINNQIKGELKTKAQLLLTDVQKERVKLDKYKGLSPRIAEKIVKVDVTTSIARDSINREDFATAVEQLQKSLENCKAILIFAVEKFQANPGKNFTDPKVGMDFIWVEPLNIWVGKYEVTNEDFRKFKPTHDSKRSMGFSLNKARQPVIEVSYYDAVGYCEWMTAISLKDISAPEGYVYRLPSREEWGTIARCGTERLYPWGNEWRLYMGILVIKRYSLAHGIWMAMEISFQLHVRWRIVGPMTGDFMGWQVMFGSGQQN